MSLKKILIGAGVMLIIYFISMYFYNFEINNFVRNSGLKDIEKTIVVFEEKAHDLEIFSTSYGEAHDCPSGCFYSTAYGLKHKDKIGWLQPPEDNEAGSYSFDKTDSYLFSSEFLTSLAKEDNRYLFHDVILPILAEKIKEDGTFFNDSSQIDHKSTKSVELQLLSFLEPLSERLLKISKNLPPRPIVVTENNYKIGFSVEDISLIHPQNIGIELSFPPSNDYLSEIIKSRDISQLANEIWLMHQNDPYKSVGKLETINLNGTTIYSFTIAQKSNQPWTYVFAEGLDGKRYRISFPAFDDESIRNLASLTF